MEAVVGHTHFRDAVQRRRIDLTAECGRRGGADVVHQDDQDVRRTLLQALRLDALLVGRALHRQARLGA